MARRNDHTREELRDLVINSSIELIKTDGFVNFSTRKVASKIGYSVGTLYNVFDNHDDIILHVNERTLDDFYNYLVAALKERGSENPIKTLATNYFQYAKENYSIWSVLFEYKLHDLKTHPDWYRKKIDRFVALVEDQLTNSVSDSKKRNIDAKLLWTGIHGLTVLTFSDKLRSVADEPVEELIDAFVGLCLGGLRGVA